MLFKSIALVAATAAVAGAADCTTKTHSLVGWSKALRSRDHDVAGTITVVDDCHFQVSGFSFDGQTPSTAWQGATTPQFVQGTMLGSDYPQGTAFSDRTETIELPDGTTWDSFKYLSFWCSTAEASFGDVRLGAGADACDFQNSNVGFSTQLTLIDHVSSGTFTVVDDCTFEVDEFTFDGATPSTQWTGSADGDYRTGVALSVDYPMTPLNIVNIEERLPAGTTWDSINSVSFWCSVAEASFAEARLRPDDDGEEEEEGDDGMDGSDGASGLALSALAVSAALFVTMW